MATDQEREAKHDELNAVSAERETKFAKLAESRATYRSDLDAAQEVSDRENVIEDEYEAMVVESEPPSRPTE